MTENPAILNRIDAALSDSPAAEPVAGQGERPWVTDETAILRRLAAGDTIVFSQDGDMAWFTKGDRAFVGDAVIRLREKGFLLRRCDDEENYRGLSEYDTISEAGLAALRPALGVVVKPLEWDEIGTHRIQAYPRYWRVGYVAWGSADGNEWSLSGPEGNIGSPYQKSVFVPAGWPSIAEAKAAAQADYEARIRSALVEAPAAGMEAAVEAAGDIIEELGLSSEQARECARAALEAARPHLSASLSGNATCFECDTPLTAPYCPKCRPGLSGVLAASPRGQEGGEG